MPLSNCNQIGENCDYFSLKTVQWWNAYMMFLNHIIRKTVLPGMAIPMLKIRRPNGRLIFNMEIALRR